VGPFSVEPSAPSDTPVRRWRRVAAWISALLVAAAAALWFWVTSVPGTFLLMLVPFLLFFAVSGLAAVAVLVEWGSRRRSDAAAGVPWPALVVVAVLVLVFVGTRENLGVRLRFEQHRESLTELATTSPLPPATEDASSGLLVVIPGYGSVEVVAVPGGMMIVTGGEGAANGLVYLADADALERWPGPTALKPLGGDWFVTV
jgi:hypothetical protein